MYLLTMSLALKGTYKNIFFNLHYIYIIYYILFMCNIKKSHQIQCSKENLNLKAMIITVGFL